MINNKRYENDLPPSSFTSEQLGEIRKSSLARILCDNGDRTDFIQPLAMVSSDIFLNAFQYCNTQIIPQIDLEKWQIPFEQSANNFSINLNVVNAEMINAREETNQMFNYELTLSSSEISPTQLMHYKTVRAKRQSIAISNQSLVLERATRGILEHLRNGRDRESFNRIDTDIHQLMQALPKIELEEYVRGTILRHSQYDDEFLEKCDENLLPCDHTSPFRTITGWCNNLQQPSQGKGLSLFERFLPPSYEDGIGSPRQMSVVKNRFLPSPRLISTNVHEDISTPHLRYVSIVL